MSCASMRFRAPYPPATFDLLARLIDRVVQSCSISAQAPVLSHARSRRVPTVSTRSIRPTQCSPKAAGSTGDSHRKHPLASWPRETVELDPPYGLATAGSSLHWMDWDTMLPRLARTLTPKAFFAVLDVDDRHAPWHERLVALFPGVFGLRQDRGVNST